MGNQRATLFCLSCSATGQAFWLSQTSRTLFTWWRSIARPGCWKLAYQLTTDLTKLNFSTWWEGLSYVYYFVSYLLMPNVIKVSLSLNKNTVFKGHIYLTKRIIFEEDKGLSCKICCTIISFIFQDNIGGISSLPVDQMTKDYRGESSFNPDLKSKVNCFPLYSILLSLGNPTVDLFSLDIEGFK